MNNVDIVYTLWSNLRKTQGMEVGQVGFHKEKEVSEIVLYHYYATPLGTQVYLTTVPKSSTAAASAGFNRRETWCDTVGTWGQFRR